MYCFSTETLTRATMCQVRGGAFFFAVFILVLIGLAIVLARPGVIRGGVSFSMGLAAAVVPARSRPGPFHQSRLLAYPLFLMVLTVPALEWLLARNEGESGPAPVLRGRRDGLYWMRANAWCMRALRGSVSRVASAF